MTGQEIRHAAEVFIGRSIESDMALIGINEAMSKIADMGFVYGTITLEHHVLDDIHYLPADLTNILTVHDEHGKTAPYWRQVGDGITFDRLGTYTIQARRIPVPIESLDETPDMNQLYHRLLVSYLRMFVLAAKSEPPQLLNDEWFLQEAARINTTLMRKRQPRQVQVIRHA